jgi:hypothetical protein
VRGENLEFQIDTFGQLLEAEELFAAIRTEYWLNHDLFTWQWWLLLVLLTIPWLLWWRVVDKRRLKEILLVGYFSTVIALMLDQLGTEFNEWDYPHRVIPVYPQFMPIDLTILPILYMLLYQYFSTWKTYMRALMIMSAAMAFLFEPLLVKMDLYRLIDWKHIYSFPAYILIGIILRLSVLKINAVSERD